MPDIRHLPPCDLFDLVMNQRYGVEYQPIIDARGAVFGYEALARFFSPEGRPISPPTVFEALHRSPLSFFEVEYAMKQLQIEQAPGEGRLFLNLDPHAAAAWGSLGPANPLLRLLSGQDNLCIELIENTDITDARISQQLTDYFSRRGIALALDDLGAPDSLLSLNVLMAVDFVKFDRSWVRLLSGARCQPLLRTLLDYVAASGKRAIIEGVETEEELVRVRGWGFELVQGFLFREAFIHRRATVAEPLAARQEGTVPLRDSWRVV